jgi:predicted DNA-binding protein with PD1-like motif
LASLWSQLARQLQINWYTVAMRFIQNNDDFIIRLETGEELLAQLTGFCAEHDIKSGYIVSGIGGVQRAAVGYYNMRKKKYINRRIKDAVELLNLSGNISELDSKPFLHLHATVSTMNNKAHGGHVHHIVIGATAEIIIRKIDQPIKRTLDTKVGLNLLDL